MMLFFFFAVQCLNDCSGPLHGACTATERGVRCICKAGWMGTDCSRSVSKCINNCNGRGTCLMGTCRCQTGYSGDDCSVKIGGGTLMDILAKNQNAQSAADNAPRFREVPPPSDLTHSNLESAPDAASLAET